MVAAKVVFFLPLAIPLNLGRLVQPVVGTVDNLDGVLSGLTSEVSSLLGSLIKILNIPSGTNLLFFVSSLITKLYGILSQLTVSAGSGLPGDVTEIINELTQILNITQGVNFLQKLIASLEQLLTQFFVSSLVNQLLGDVTQIDLLRGVVNDLKMSALLSKLVGSLKQILDVVKVANV